MNYFEKNRDKKSDDQVLLWTMRVLGAILTTFSLFLLSQDIFTSAVALWFFGTSAGLGITTTVTSFIPLTRKRIPLKPSPITSKVYHRQKRYSTHAIH